MKILIDKIAGITITYNKNKVIPAIQKQEYIDKLLPNGKYFCAGYDKKGNDVYIELYSNIKKKS